MFLLRELRTSVGMLASMLPEGVREVLPCPRQVHRCAGGLRVELRHLGAPGTSERATELEERLCALDGAGRAEVNGALGFVFVECDPDAADIRGLTAVVDEFDTLERDAAGSGGAGPRRARHPVEQRAAALVELGAGLLGLGLTLAGQAVQTTRAPATLPALLQLAESTPRVRHELERRLGRPTANLLFATTRFTVQAIAMRPLAMLIDSMGAAGRYIEAHANGQAWAAREEEFAVRKGAYHHICPDLVSPRPAPLSYGPIERLSDTAAVGALASYGLTSVVSPDRERALGMLVTNTPKAARLGREAFLIALGRALARRGALVLDRDALRRADRVDTVVFDADVLTLDAWTIHEVIPVGSAPGVDTDQLHARVYTLLEGADATARREQGDWAVTPLPSVPDEASHWREQDVYPTAVSYQGRRVALVGMVPELHPYAEALVEAARRACRVLLAGGHPSLAWRLGTGEPVEGGARLPATVRGLQAEGHGVVLVTRFSRRGLRESDIGIGLLTGSDRLPWEAAVLGTAEAVHLLLKALPVARTTSKRSVKATVAGMTAGSALTLLGPATGAVRRVQLLGDATSLLSFGAGAWTARNLGRDRLPQQVDRTPWHALPVQDVLTRISSAPTGLTEAEATRRRTAPGEEDGGRPLSLMRATAEELANPLTPVLAAAAGVSAVVGSVLDAALIGIVLGVNGLIGGVQRSNADRALTRLAGAAAIRVRLRRPQGTVSATSGDLVPGDVIELRAGDAVPADCRVIKARGLEVDEAPLTGESQLVSKSPAPTAEPALAERTSMVYQGTTIAAGYCLGVVVATGAATEAGRTARMSTREAPPTGVELRLRALSRQIMPLAIGSGVLLMLTNLLRRSSAAAAVAPAVSLAVAALPEGLPFIATVAELSAARRLSARETLVRNPSTIEALGRVDVLCFDKTGTLTEGRISLGRVSDGRVEHPAENLPPEFRHILAAALRAGPEPSGERVVPHLTDRAVLEGADRLGVTPSEGPGGWERVAELPFEPARGYHAVLGKIGDGHLLSVKGAPEVVLTRCATVHGDGEETPLDEVARRSLAKEVDRLAQQGYRVLAVAERPASNRGDLDESRIGELCFLGFLGLADPVRPTAAQSVRRLARAGVRVVMITGDHPSTAEAIGAELNVLNGMRVMTGPELDEISDEALADALPEVSIFARVTPAHKARIVAGLQRAGKVVAVTGDGANDAPAIRLADVGVALGSRATPAARSAADVVVTDDRIETIVEAIVEGRAMWSSVRDALSILLGGNLGEITFTVGSNLILGRNTLNARQLLLVNLLTDMLPALAIAVRPPSATSPEKLLREGPEASLGAALNRAIYVRAGATAASAGAAWLLARATGTAGRADTVGLIGLVAAQLMQTLMVGGRDPMVIAAASASMACLFVAVSTPGLSGLFGCRPVGPLGWAIGLGSGAVSGLAGRLISKMEAEPAPAEAEPVPAAT
ncbi:HAD-IC family P-type ATPase [Sphaerisporangium fuscum]|uniref:HAD-IC family P-type ATPase n=1 Tax=Sphaerisporangium fuscum TaxID=2835868 RepID=UPI0027E2EAB8|nr:HAD-IC family P-type ATPase [Sphaerisporangium fuscum]